MILTESCERSAVSDTTITIREAADLCGMSYYTLAQAAREGRIKARKSGDVWLTTREAISEAIKEGKLRPRPRKQED